MLLRHWGRKSRANERGSALVAVLGVMVVGLLLTTLIASSVVRAFGSSTSTRAAMQSHAAADAGIAAARAGLYTLGNCALQPTPGQYISSGSLVYTAKVLFDSGAGFTAGCPNATTTRVRILSQGTAQSFGVAGVTAGNTRTVEATFNYLTPGPQPSGPAIDLFAGGVVESNSGINLTGSGGLVIQNGDLNCAKNGSVFTGDVVVKGNLNFSTKCTLIGNATVAGLADLGSSGNIVQTLTASSANPVNPKLTGQAGAYVQTTAVPPTPPWTDVGYTPGVTPLDWTDLTYGTFQYQKAGLLGRTCALNSGNLGGTPAGYPVIIDLLSCPSGPTLSPGNTSILLTSDVVIYAQQFDFSGVNTLNFGSSDTSVHRLWFITPDYVADGKPTCNYQYLPGTATSKSLGTLNPAYNPANAVQGDFLVKNNLTVAQVFSTTNLVRAMLYTPCAFDAKNGFTWNGQILAGNPSFLQNTSVFTADSVGIAGYDLGTGARTIIVTVPHPGAPISNRDLAGG